MLDSRLDLFCAPRLGVIKPRGVFSQAEGAHSEVSYDCAGSVHALKFPRISRSVRDLTLYRFSNAMECRAILAGAGYFHFRVKVSFRLSSSPPALTFTLYVYPGPKLRNLCERYPFANFCWKPRLSRSSRPPTRETLALQPPYNLIPPGAARAIIETGGKGG